MTIDLYTTYNLTKELVQDQQDRYYKNDLKYYDVKNSSNSRIEDRNDRLPDYEMTEEQNKLAFRTKWRKGR